MAFNGWNSARFGGEQSTPNGSSITPIACRVCDKIYLTPRSLLAHYETHEAEFARRRQNRWQGTELVAYLRDMNNPFPPPPRVNPSSTTFHNQRIHQYLSNMNQTNSSVPVPTQNPQVFQLRNQTVTSDSNLAVNQTTGIPGSQPGQSMRSNWGYPMPQLSMRSNVDYQMPQPSMRSNSDYQMPQPIQRNEYQKGYDEFGDKRTIWYLGKLEQPIRNYRPT